MISLTPNSAPTDVSLAFAILQLASDPEATKARLTELQELVDRANLGLERANKMQDDADRRLQLVTEGTANLEKDKATFDQFRKDTDARHAAAQADHVQQKTDHEAKAAAFNESAAKREADVTAREAAVTEREHEASEREASLAAREANVAKRWRAMQEISKAAIS